MKKFVFYFIFYIGSVLSVFNTALAENAISAAKEAKPLVYIHVEDDGSTAPQTTKEKTKRPNQFKKLTAEIYKIILTPFIINKLYPDKSLEQDITGTLKQLYPTASKETLETISSYTKSFIYVKRRYDYVIARLEQQIKAAQLLPKDELIVAEDGEFISEFPEEKKQSDNDEYNVKYKPYKYIGYDTGELGEPVRRRDKNYQEKITDIDEIILAMLKFDIPGFVKAMNKLPQSTDNSAEKPIELANGVKARLLMANSSAGDNPKLRAVIEVYIPEGKYITGDILNPHTRPRFFLSEDIEANNNISGYELYLPEANGVVKDGITKRILVGTVRYPIEFTRRDVEKPTLIKGNFTFEVCDKEGTCEQALTTHEFTVKPSLDEDLSIYYNYVTQGFTHLPSEKAKHAELKSAVYDEQTGQLTVTFKTTQTFSQAAVMVEDAHGTNYLEPRYSISDNEVTATFNIAPATAKVKQVPLAQSPSPLVENHPLSAPQSKSLPVALPLAITARFDNIENLRTITTPSQPATVEVMQVPLAPLVENPPLNTPQPKVKQVRLALVLTPFAPGIFYLFISLLWLLWNRKDRAKILFRYALGSALGVSAIAFTVSGHYWSTIYENAALTTLSAVVVTSFLCECMGYMNFNWFRPLKRIFGQGLFLGFFSVILISAFPLPITGKILSPLSPLPPDMAFPRWAMLWLGLQILPLLALFFPLKNRPNFFPFMRELNIAYNFIYLTGCLYLIGLLRGEAPVWLTIGTLGLTWSLWYLYPKAINETIRHTRSEKKQRALYHNVERHALIGIIILTLLTYAAISSYPVEKALPAPTPTEVMANHKQEQTPILISVTAPWSITGTLNIAYLKKLENKGIKTILINAVGEAENAAPWFNTYQKPYAPLNVLFTKRHPYGLVLPNALSQIDWQAALDTFEEHIAPENKEERTEPND